jgi:paraquat-inducible protein B
MPDSPSTPTALLLPARPRGRARALPWLIPLAALLVALLLIAQSLAARGPRLTLAFADGHGLKPNDPVVFRGVQVGRIRDVGIRASDQHVRVDIELARDVTFLRRFWIVRPELSLSRVAGLETLVGPRYIAADTGGGGGDPSTSPTSPLALESPPPDTITDGLPLLIRAARAGSLAPGSPVSYRELPVGSVTSVTLASDARSVEIAIRIAPEHAHLVRTNSVFWNVSGIGLDLGLVGGLKLKAESLQTVLAGGLAFATPDKPDPAEPAAAPNTEFPLSDYDASYLKWTPVLSPTTAPPTEPRP